MRRTTRYKGIYKLGENHFQVRVQAGQDPLTGRFKESTRNLRGSLEDALDLQGEMRREAKQSFQVWSNPTVAELCLRFLEHADVHLSPSTAKKYRSEYKDKIDGKALASRRARTVTTEELDRYFHALKDERGIKGKTVNKFRSFLNSVWRQAMAWKIVNYNPVDATTVFYSEEYEGEAVEYGTIKAVLDAYETVDFEMGLLLELAMINQLRRSEVCGIRAANVDLEGQLLTIDEVILEPKGGGYVRKPYLKNKQRKRVIDLDPRSIEILSKFLPRTALPGFVFSDNDGVDPWLPGRVSQSQGRMRKRICPTCLTYGLDEECQPCETKRGVYFRVHDLRAHTTTALIERGMSKAAQERGGWKDEHTMLKHYMRYTKKARSEAVATITELFGKGA